MDLSNNELASLPSNLSMLPAIEHLNLTGNPIENIEQAADAIYSIGPSITNLGINLHEE
jgi:Leucine-rich repeat (LRR) protein